MGHLLSVNVSVIRRVGFDFHLALDDYSFLAKEQEVI